MNVENSVHTSRKNGNPENEGKAEKRDVNIKVCIFKNNFLFPLT